MPRDFLKGARDQYDVVVIGAGLAGMTAANTLARAGHSVLLLEQHYRLGGLATWFRRPGGHIFDVSLHGFPHGMLKSCRRYWSPQIADSIVQLKKIRFDNPMFSLVTTFDRGDFTRLLTDRFGIPAQTVREFFDAARGMNFYDDQALDNRAALRSLFSRAGGRGAAVDGADHLCQRLDPGRSRDYLRNRLLQLHVEGGLHFPRRDGSTDPPHAGRAPRQRRRCPHPLPGRENSRSRAPRRRGDGRRPDDQDPGGPFQRQPPGHDLPAHRSGSVLARLSRTGPGGPLEQLERRRSTSPCGPASRSTRMPAATCYSAPRPLHSARSSS